MMRCKKKWAKCYFKTYGDFGMCYAVRKQLIKKFLGKYIWLNILHNEHAAARGGQNTIIYEMWQSVFSMSWATRFTDDYKSVHDYKFATDYKI